MVVKLACCLLLSRCIAGLLGFMLARFMSSQWGVLLDSAPPAALGTALTHASASLGIEGEYGVAVPAEPVPGRRLKEKTVTVHLHPHQGCKEQMGAYVLTPAAA